MKQILRGAHMSSLIMVGYHLNPNPHTDINQPEDKSRKLPYPTSLYPRCIPRSVYGFTSSSFVSSSSGPERLTSRLSKLLAFLLKKNTEGTRTATVDQCWSMKRSKTDAKFDIHYIRPGFDLLDVEPCILGSSSTSIDRLCAFLIPSVFFFN